MLRAACLLLVAVGLAAPAAAQSSYRLQAGDTIEVNVFQEPSLSRQVVVAPDGRISYLLVGHLRVSGLTLESVERVLKEGFQKYYNSELDVTAILVGMRKGPDEKKTALVYVTGEVGKPGAFPITKGTSVLQVIAMAGGLSPYAAKGRIHVRRRVNDQEVVFPFDYNDVEEGRDLVGNIELLDGDVLVVPERGLFE